MYVTGQYLADMTLVIVTEKNARAARSKYNISLFTYIGYTIAGTITNVIAEYVSLSM